MVPSVSKRAVAAASVALLIAALFGAYRGFRGATTEADVAAASEGLMPTASALAARQASPLAEPTAATLTEAQIRVIARQEAQAALNAGNAPPASDPAANAAAAAETPAPAPAPVAPPAPAAQEPNQPPLF